MKTFGFACLIVGLTLVSNASGSNKKGVTPTPSPNPQQQQLLQQQYLQQTRQAQQKHHHAAHPGSNGPVGQTPMPNANAQGKQWDCAKKNGTGSKTGNGNWNGNKNGNGNANANKNTNNNGLSNTNDINIKLNVGKNGKNGTNGTNNGNLDGTLTGGFPNGFNNGFGSGFNPNYGGGSYSPSGGSFTYAPSYDFSGAGYGMPLGLAGGALGLPMPAVEDPNTAAITLDLPDDQAEVWLNDQKMPHKGQVRKYVTPPLEKDKIYNYDIKVQWPDKGKLKGAKLNYNTTLQFKAGDDILHKVPGEGEGVKAAPPLPNKDVPPQDEAKNMAQKLAWAKDLLNNGKKDKAKERLQEIVERSPDSAAGREAKELLGKIN